MIHDTRRCELGEGPLWHPTRNQLFWFDILNNQMLSQDRDGPRVWKFPEVVSAAGWVSHDVLLIAGERDLFLFDLETEEVQSLCLLEADKPQNRPNDGRADRQGGFWIGTMGKGTEPGAGSIYRFYRGELRLLYSDITVTNSICFAPDGKTACFADTMTGQVMRVALDADGWPNAAPQVYLDLTAQGLNPDGAVIDAAGNIWVALWGASKVACYDPAGNFLREVGFAGSQTSCPAFGGPDLTTLFCTTALEAFTQDQRDAEPDGGKTFAAPGVAKGLPEPQVLL